MTSFSSKIKEKRNEHAYYLGTCAYAEGLSMQNDYEQGSKLDEDWLNGYLDAMYLRNV